MDRYVTVTKKSASGASASEKQDKERSDRGARYHPYAVGTLNERRPGDWAEKRRIDDLFAPLVKDGARPTTAAIRKRLLTTLSDESNPITHSDIYHRSDHVTSMATGHQRSDGRANQSQFLKLRSKKLEEQLSDQSTSSVGILHGVRVYIDGYIENTTDIEMKRIVTLAGGTVMYTAAAATHILTSMQLSGSKTHKLSTSRKPSSVHVIRPEWVFDCISAGKRLPERTYLVAKPSASSIADTLGAGPSSGARKPPTSPV